MANSKNVVNKINAFNDPIVLQNDDIISVGELDLGTNGTTRLERFCSRTENRQFFSWFSLSECGYQRTPEPPSLTSERLVIRGGITHFNRSTFRRSLQNEGLSPRYSFPCGLPV